MVLGNLSGHFNKFLHYDNLFNNLRHFDENLDGHFFEPDDLNRHFLDFDNFDRHFDRHFLDFDDFDWDLFDSDDLNWNVDSYGHFASHLALHIYIDWNLLHIRNIDYLLYFFDHFDKGWLFHYLLYDLLNDFLFHNRNVDYLDCFNLYFDFDRHFNNFGDLHFRIHLNCF